QNKFPSKQCLDPESTLPTHLLIPSPFPPASDDKTRVALGEARDYINASYIRMAVGPEEFQYISCQGPLPATARAFWQMVWENKSDVVAMMTQEVERGRIKCHKYWPETPSQALEEGRFQLLVCESPPRPAHARPRPLALSWQTGATHVVRHLKFTHWPDHGVPHSSEQLVRFIRYLRAVHHSGPLTVHCSAGIGRTGVLICTDVILSLIENDLPINVGDIVREMRLQRYGMIQTKVSGYRGSKFRGQHLNKANQHPSP
uniref:Protein tyrosine phosphatase non-receptor type 20 n=1 Tax=Gadus morhua TaxID=8049 RepID=A0A8C5D676_GADMO